jgi:hypothetical protein
MDQMRLLICLIAQLFVYTARMVRQLMGVVLGLLLTACGGDDGGTAGSGGASSGGGGSGSGGGGQGSMTRGAFSMHIVPSQGCSLAEQWVDFPVVDGGHPVTATETVQTIPDGATEQVTNSSGMLIDTTASRLTCTWLASVFRVGFRFGPAGREGVLSMSAGTTLGESRTMGFVLQGQDWRETTYGGQCTYTALEVDVATRSVRGELSCPALDAVTDMPDTQPHETCTIPTGYYAFENCVPL